MQKNLLGGMENFRYNFQLVHQLARTLEVLEASASKVTTPKCDTFISMAS
jgi:hypothetical protein